MGHRDRSGSDCMNSDVGIIEVGDAEAPGVTLGAVAFAYTYDKEKNLERFEGLVETAAGRGVDLLVFPEAALNGAAWSAAGAWEGSPEALRHHYETSETIPGPMTKRLCGVAAEHNMLLAVHMNERHPHYGKGKGGLYSAAVLLSGDGVLHVHRKVHIAGPERHIFRHGREIAAVDTTIGRLALSICYDMMFPETARIAAIEGADILLFQTAWSQTFDPSILGHDPDFAGSSNYSLSALLGIRAWENQMWIVAASAAGTDERLDLKWWGEAKIVGPDGITRAQTPLGEEGMAIVHGCDIEEEIIRSRTDTYWGDSFMFDRMPGVYSSIADVDKLYP